MEKTRRIPGKMLLHENLKDSKGRVVLSHELLKCDGLTLPVINEYDQSKVLGKAHVKYFQGVGLKSDLEVPEELAEKFEDSGTVLGIQFTANVKDNTYTNVKLLAVNLLSTKAPAEYNPHGVNVNL